MDFGYALTRLRGGDRVTRKGWNAAGQWVVLQKGYPEGVAINANTADATGIPESTVCIFRPYLLLRTADGSFVPWQPTVSDALAKDWRISPPGLPDQQQPAQ